MTEILNITQKYETEAHLRGRSLLLVLGSNNRKWSTGSINRKLIKSCQMFKLAY